ncbi:MAG: hypothetical protein ACOYD4_06950 [Solirubrobacterales bacterium]
MADVAFLVYEPLKERRKDNSFDGNDNIGAKVIADVLQRAGIEVGYCAPETAHEYQVVLVSLTSTHDVFAYYQAVSLLPSWQPDKRKFKVLAGGFGMQNPTSIRRYVDYAAFGRAHDWVTSVVDALLGGGEPSEHPSLMCLPDLHPVEIHQTDDLFTAEGVAFKESFTGCPLKCKFCHYTYARKYNDNRETKGSYVQESLTGGGTPELTWDGLFTYGKKLGRVRVAIDGFSERLRYLYGKRIANDDIIAGLETVGSYEGNTVVLTYNIANFPHETEEDREDLYKALRQVKPKNRVEFVLHSTPFRPSLVTPMQWEPVTLLPDWSKRRSEVIVESPTFRAVHSFTLETPFTHLMSVIAERATPETDKLFHICAHSPDLRKGTAEQKLRKLSKAFDLSPYTRQYDPKEPHPVWFLQGSVDTQQLTRIATKMREQIDRTIREPGWLPGTGSMVKQRLAAHQRTEIALEFA